jgi:hypothetical protein
MDLTISRFTLAEIGNWVHADQITGRIVHIPTGKVFVEPLAVYSRGMHDFIWNEVAVLVTFESNWKRAKDILNEIAVNRAGHLAEPAESKLKEYARDFLVVPVDLTPTVFTTVAESGVLLTVRHVCRSRHRRESTQEIWEDERTTMSERVSAEPGQSCRRERNIEHPSYNKPAHSALYQALPFCTALFRQPLRSRPVHGKVLPLADCHDDDNDAIVVDLIDEPVAGFFSLIL